MVDKGPFHFPNANFSLCVSQFEAGQGTNLQIWLKKEKEGVTLYKSKFGFPGLCIFSPLGGLPFPCTAVYQTSYADYKERSHCRCSSELKS